MAKKKQPKFYWYRFRIASSASHGTWQYDISDISDLKELSENVKESWANIFSEHYRGTTVEKIPSKKVPLEVLQRKIESLTEKIPDLERRILTTKERLSALQKQEKNKQWRIPRREKCIACKGKGWFLGWSNTKYDCQHCNKTGYVKGE